MLFKNIIIILFVLLLGIIALYIALKMKMEEILPEEEDKYSLSVIVSHVREFFNSLIGTACDRRRYLSGREIEKEKERQAVQNAVRTCNHGNSAAKALVKNYIKNWLMNDYLVEADECDRVLAFENPGRIKPQDKFEIMLFFYTREYGTDAARVLLKELLEINRLRHKVNAVSSVQLCIDAEDVDVLFDEKSYAYSVQDKADIITQLIYRQYKGHGIIDSLRDCDIDGISAGVSGRVSPENILRRRVMDEWGDMSDETEPATENYDSVWVFLNGNMVRLGFMSFESETELERVCKNVYRYNNPGQLSASKGYIANEMQDGSRVIVVRPPFAESWAFFIRKFGNRGVMKVNELIKGRGSEDLITMLRFLIAGCQVFGITGEQGCGKTTMLKALVEFIPPEYTLRVQELIFELHLRDEYPKRNIISFKETPEISGREGLDLQKKTDGTVNIIGEVATAAVAGWLVMVSQVASRFTIFTHHAKTTDSLIFAMRNDLMSSAGFNNEEIAEAQVRNAIRFDVHMVKLPDGSRKIKRINEIFRETKNGRSYRTLLELTENGYVVLNPISTETEKEMIEFMQPKEKAEFLDAQLRWRKGGINEKQPA